LDGGKVLLYSTSWRGLLDDETVVVIGRLSFSVRLFIASKQIMIPYIHSKSSAQLFYINAKATVLTAVSPTTAHPVLMTCLFPNAIH